MSSPWLRSDRAERSPLRRTRSFDIAVIGGGIAGLTTALLLKEAGAQVAVLEGDRIASGATGHNTAKVTALQSTMYTTIRQHRGTEAAQVYAAASSAAVEKIAELADPSHIRRRSAFTFAVDAEGSRAVEQEVEAARAAGLPVTSDALDELPFPVTGAARLADQLEIDPVRYAAGLAERVDGDGCAVFEHSRALQLAEGAPCRITTSGGTLTADRVVVATHAPVWDRGLFFAMLQAVRSYCIAARLREEPPRGLSITAGQPTRSLRSLGDQLIVCGEGHEAGAAGIGEERYTRLEAFAREHWPVAEITHRWSAQDLVPHDRFPMVGPYLPGSSRLFVATGFMKWGLTGGTFAGMVLADLLSDRANPWSEALSPWRLSPSSWPRLAWHNLSAGVDFVTDRLSPAKGADVTQLKPGTATVVRDGTERTGVYRDENGLLHCVSLRCTHLGCLVRFNAAESTWDCPCHGSRFAVDGSVLEGPAVRPLAVKPPPEPGV
ncbi:FAD-dependent oxidoreductase [Saccharopolyspora rhizosphaerae]|uniref:FAD-dependent oxidoreductase n=1 Tax=Saccharopolyspora rhizosphaerae TaxID=2492662 RepID=A0A3R8P0B0_9PSEU|nr:FAD-dependent oxidoreductase [Saccharopolyspora rhizosphaerae]RRO16730.1 FAD-dependent oxidoreductase [Saccharopolyspora rhizosphaerae]